jgi:phosphohistidine phosphatase
MRLLVLRHGRAEPFKTSDANRALLASGRADVQHIVKRQREAIGELTEVWVSPFLRTRQTAQIATDTLALPPECQRISELLVPGASVDDLIEALYQSSLAAVLLVSHQPLVSNLLDALCGPSELHDMQPASLAALELDVVAKQLGQLRWIQHM